ncbi:MAG: hypothetical protein HQK49_01990 [Oligoflexia bacterium]|nr:hypothetical protein [Oligoflexia bacterium]
MNFLKKLKKLLLKIYHIKDKLKLRVVSKEWQKIVDEDKKFKEKKDSVLDKKANQIASDLNSKKYNLSELIKLLKKLPDFITTKFNGDFVIKIKRNNNRKKYDKQIMELRNIFTNNPKYQNITSVRVLEDVSRSQDLKNFFNSQDDSRSGKPVYFKDPKRYNDITYENLQDLQ